jgi:hypothetical protein
MPEISRFYGTRDEETLKITNARVVNDFSMLITFSTGEKRLFDGTLLWDKEAFAPLRDESVFNNFILQHGILTWDNGNIDIAPEYLYRMSFDYDDNPRELVGAART